MNLKTIFLVFLIISFHYTLNAHEFHVSKQGKDTNDGSSGMPFRTIGAAVKVAYPGDTITVHEGIYREWVNPVRGGTSDSRRIIYRAAPGEKAEIKGSEEIKGWKKLKEGIWTVSVPDTFFGLYNPFRDSVYGDWFDRMGRVHHTGDVFLNGKSLYEVENPEKVFNPVAYKGTRDSAGSLYTWHCTNEAGSVTIIANFHKFNPNKEMTEISARRTCFYPDQPGIDYITLTGFHISQAATQWGAPTAEQVGMVATHWNKGWIIENNVISNSKCSGITLGKEKGTGHNVWSQDRANVNNDGNIHYIEVTFRVLRNGWSKEKTGSHIVRNNTIFNCEQTGICGSMGAAFSAIENNHIYNIWSKRQFSGAEIGGIKFHAAIDATLKHNRIHDCGRGIWLDWMTQGTRVTSNLFYNNDLEDLFLEVNHGPFIVDNNIFLSRISVRTQSEGGAYIHNLITGAIQMWPEPNRFTPYFLPHSTDMAGLTTIFSGDDRFYNNVIVGRDIPGVESGLETYNKARLPVWISDNIYYNGAKTSGKETGSPAISSFNPGISLVERADSLYLIYTFDDLYFNMKGKLVTTEMLGKAKIPKAAFDNPDGSPVQFDSDYFGNKRSPDAVFAGPFAASAKGRVEVKVW
jgi:hypothetical protein